MNPVFKVSPPSRVGALLAGQPAGHSLLRQFYRDDDVYQLDLECIWRRGWLFAGHSCEIPSAGDYFTLAVDTDSILVIRDEEGRARALHNVCRHRGSLIRGDDCGHVKRLICPYHQWRYDLGGRLVHAPGMQADLDTANLGLHPVQLRETQGLIYISLADEPPDFEPAHALLGSMAKPQGLERAKIAKAVEYRVRANWKLVWENNRECFHCNANHPQYTKANFDHYNSDDASPRIREQMAAAVGRSEAKWAASGLAANHTQTGMTTFPDPDRNIWYSANRTVLVDGYVSESMDGKPVAPLMGDYLDPDVGTLRIRTLPNFWNHSSCDHSVSTQLLPVAAQLTAVRVCWLVDRNAVEGQDYDLDKVLPFWQLTSEQDWEICERQQRGVNSSTYTPGPYSIYKEYNVDAFVRWYLKQLQAKFP